jgi:DNA (cytosine-5)-methyltransferase 1
VALCEQADSTAIKEYCLFVHIFILLQNAQKIPRDIGMTKEAVYALLQESLQIYSRKDLAEVLEVDVGTVRRWMLRESEPKPYLAAQLKLLLPFPQQKKRGEFTFIDLFAGIGGLRMAFESIGGECVFTSEWDNYAQRTYMANFVGGHELNGDITQIDASNVPDHDVLLAGFPCQPFSIAGVSKKNSLGRKHGFADKTQGTLFFDVARIIDKKRPKAFLLENVKNLLSHDKGRTFETIRQTLVDELGYSIYVRVIDGQHFVPQHRERIVIVGFSEPQEFSWNDLVLPPKDKHCLDNILHRDDGKEPVLDWDGNRFFNHEKNKVDGKYVLSDKLWDYLKLYKEKHQAKGNGFGYGLVGKGDVARTLSARYYKDGSEILIKRGRGNPRRLTPRECARLMGFPDTYRIPVSDTRAYKQFGNSVVMLVFAEVARIMKPFILDESVKKNQEDMGFVNKRNQNTLSMFVMYSKDNSDVR